MGGWGFGPTRLLACQTMLGYCLPDHVGFGLVEDEAVFLDLNRDRYYRLDPSANAAFHALLRTTGSDAQRTESSRRLLEAGVLVPAPTAAPLAAARCSLADASALDLPLARARPSAGSVAEAWWRLVQMRRQLRQGRLASMIEALRASKRHNGSSEHSPEKAETLAATFIAARRMVPIAPNCLPDSLALSFYHARRALHPELVFGVKLDPFAAHCWVQTDRLVLNDSRDTIDGFVPVLVV